MLCLARLPFSGADAESYWQWPWTLVNSIFPVKHTGVFGRISLVEIGSSKPKEHDNYQWFARAVSDSQFLSFAVPKFMGQEEDIRILSIIPSSGDILALVNTEKPAVSKYSAASNTWEALPPMISQARSCPTFPGVVIGDFFYAVSGFSRRFFRVVERLDLRSNKWEKIPAMHNPHIQGKYFAMDGRLFVIHSPCSKHPSGWAADIFDPATNQWTLVEDFLPPGSKHFSFAVLKNELYMLTWTDTKPQRVIMRYNKSGGMWGFVDFVPHTSGRSSRKKRLCPVGNELWVLDCAHRQIQCVCDEVCWETSVWPVVKGPSFWPKELENKDPKPDRFIHAYRVEGLSDEPAWRTIPVFCL